MVLVVAIVCMVLYFTGVFTKQVPIYTGMEISSVSTSADDSSTNAVSYKYSGDYTGRSDGLDKNNPYGSGSATIENKAASTLTVVGAGEDIYYADAGEDIYIIVKFDNPDYYKIESFVLYDGTTEIYYADYNFRSDSTFERIIVQLNVGDEGGIKEYTISEILYLDDKVNKDVIIGGDPVVRCGVRVSGMTSATVTDETTTLTSISFNVNIVDKYSIISYSKDYYAMAILYDGESIIQTADLEVGENSVTFENLTPDTIYQYAVVAYYDDLSGSGAALNFLYTNALYTPAIVLFDEDSITIDQTSITFDYSWYSGYSGSITSLTLTGGGETVTLDTTATSVTGLLSNNEYKLTATYAGTNGDSGTITLEFTTEAKATPNVAISAVATQETISYELAITDTDNVGSLTSVTLSLNGEKVKTLTGLTGTVSGLLSNNTYTITALYIYDLNDGNGEQTAEFTKEITTLAKATPEVEITVTDATVSTLTFNVNYTDTDGVGKITAIELYKGDTRVQSASSLNQVEYIFSGLDSYTNYTLKVSYSYDLNDGDGTHTAEQTLTENTYPLVEFTSIKIINTSAVVEGSTISIQAAVNNPSGVAYNSVVVNGETYSVSALSTDSVLYINITNNGQFAGGETILTVSQVICTLDGKTYTIDISGNNSVTQFINGTLTVEDFYIARYNSATKEYEQTYYSFPSETLYYVISLGNATCYDITSITITDNYAGANSAVYTSEITMSADYQTAYIPVNIASASYGIITLSKIAYSNSNVNKTDSVDITNHIIGLNSDEVVEITTVEQLLDVGGNKYYKLMNDIDLSDYTSEWVNMGIAMTGVFDGNGHTISGMGAVTDYSNTDLSLGLFGEVYGLVMNLNITDIRYILNLTNTTGTGYNVRIGAVGIYTATAILSNVNVEMSAEFTTSGNYDIYFCNGGSGLYFQWGLNVCDNCTASAKIIINDDIYYIDDGDSYKFSYSGGEYTLVDYSGSETELVLPESINGKIYSIGESAFRSCTSLTSVIIPDNISIGISAFSYCTSLTSVVMGNNVTIGNSAFDYCGSLTSVIMGSNVSVGENAFHCCTSLTSITIPDGFTSIADTAYAYCTSLTSITIPDSVTNIGASAFYNCNSLTSVVIGSGVTEISWYAFYDCKSLKAVYCKGSEQLTTVYTDGSEGLFVNNYQNSNSYLLSATWYYYSETEPTESGNYWHYVNGEATPW